MSKGLACVAHGFICIINVIERMAYNGSVIGM